MFETGGSGYIFHFSVCLSTNKHRSTASVHITALAALTVCLAECELCLTLHLTFHLSSVVEITAQLHKTLKIQHSWSMDATIWRNVSRTFFGVCLQNTNAPQCTQEQMTFFLTVS